LNLGVWRGGRGKRKRKDERGPTVVQGSVGGGDCCKERNWKQ